MLGKCKKYIQLKNAWLPHEPTHVWACLKNWWGLVRSQALWLSADHHCRGRASFPTASHSPVHIHHFRGLTPAFVFIVVVGWNFCLHLCRGHWNFTSMLVKLRLKQGWWSMRNVESPFELWCHMIVCWLLMESWTQIVHSFFPPLIHVQFTPHFASSLLGSAHFRLASSSFAVVIPLFLLVSSWCFHPAPSMLATLTPSFASLSLVCEYFPPS